MYETVVVVIVGYPHIKLVKMMEHLFLFPVWSSISWYFAAAYKVPILTFAHPPVVCITFKAELGHF